MVQKNDQMNLQPKIPIFSQMKQKIVENDIRRPIYANLETHDTIFVAISIYYEGRKVFKQIMFRSNMFATSVDRQKAETLQKNRRRSLHQPVKILMCYNDLV